MLIDAIPGFEFPRKVLSYQLLLAEVDEDKAPIDAYIVPSKAPGKVKIDNSAFAVDLSSEEINILAILMMNGWLQRQVTSIEIVRMKYTGTDFKMTSQANHLAKLLNLLAETQRQSHHMQRLYKRRRTDEQGNIHSNWSCLREVSALDN